MIRMDIFAHIKARTQLAATVARSPTPAQAEAGNYRKARFRLHGLPIVIENPQGTYRHGVSPDGKAWSNRMAADYGDIAGTLGADGDPVDVFVGPWPESEKVWVINQVDQKGAFDEHKVLLAFPDESSARSAYLGSYDRGWRGLGDMIACTPEQLKWWLKFGNKKQPISLKSLPYDGRTAMNEITWDSAGNPVGTDIAGMIYQIRRDDADGLMLDAVTVLDIMEASDGEQALDALVIPMARMDRKMEQIRAIMAQAGDAVKPLAVQVTSPFKQRGTTNVAAVFELADGQTVSIYFHNPDTTPNKITPADDLVSWKWMLNKKDITLLVAPEKGADLNPREVARRIMKLAERNSVRFAAANTKRAERMASIAGLKEQVTAKESALASLDAEIDALSTKVEEKRRTQAPSPGNSETMSEVVVSEELKQPAIAGKKAPFDIPAINNEFEVLAKELGIAEDDDQERSKIEQIGERDGISSFKYRDDVYSVAKSNRMPDVKRAVSFNAGLYAIRKESMPGNAVATAQATEQIGEGGVLADALLQLDIGALKRIASKYVFNTENKDKNQLVREVMSSGYSAEQILRTVKELSDFTDGSPIVNKIYNSSEWPQAKLGWRVLGDDVYGKKIAGYSTEQSAKIAISKNKWTDIGATVVPFRFRDSSKGMLSAQRVETRYAIVAKDDYDAKPAQPAPQVDYKGFDQKDSGNGSFTLTDGNMTVTVQPTGDGKYQASFNGAKSSPHLQGVQGAVDWADAYRSEAQRVANISAKATANQDPYDLFESMLPEGYKYSDGIGEVRASKPGAKGIKLDFGRWQEVGIRAYMTDERGSDTIGAFPVEGGDFASAIRKAIDAVMAEIAKQGGAPQKKPYELIAEQVVEAWKAGGDDAAGKKAAELSSGLTVGETAAISDAIQRALAPLRKQKKRDLVMSGKTQIMSDKELDDWAADGMPADVVSAPNPDQAGILDAWIVGLASNESMQALKQIANKESDPEESDPEQSAYSPFDASQIRVPSASQLGAKSALGLRPLGGSEGWTNGHFLDVTGMSPAIAKKADDIGRDKLAPVSQDGWERVLKPAKASATTEVEPTAFYDSTAARINNSQMVKSGGKKSNTEEISVNAVILTNEQAGISVALNRHYFAYFFKQHKGAKFYASDETGPVIVKKGGEVVGVVMPVRTGGTNILKRAMRAAGRDEQAPAPAESPAEAAQVAEIRAGSADSPQPEPADQSAPGGEVEQAQQAEQTGEDVTAAADRQEAATFLQSVIDGNADIMAPDIADRIGAIADRYSDAEMVELTNRAAEAYTQAVIAEAKKALA